MNVKRGCLHFKVLVVKNKFEFKQGTLKSKSNEFICLTSDYRWVHPKLSLKLLFSNRYA